MLAALAAGPAAAQQPPGGGGRQPSPTAVAAAQPGRPAGGLGGRVMYFQKPADALGTDAAGDRGVELAMATTTAPGSDVALVIPVSASAPVSEATLPAPTPVPVPVPTEAVAAQRPTAEGQPYNAQKQDLGSPIAPVDPKVTQLPSRDKIFIMYDDAQLERAIVRSVRDEVRQRLRKGGFELKNDDERYYRFPELAALVPPGTQYAAKTAEYPPRTTTYEANFTVHRRLHFEEKNAERYGWDLGIIQPIVSTMYFYKDTLLWPNSLASGLEVGFWDTNAGKCLPGNPVPYLLYPPALTITGTATEAAIVTGAAFVIVP